MKQLGLKLTLISLVLLTVNICCKEKIETATSVYRYIEPRQDSIQIVVSFDTLCFHLDTSTFTAIKSFNLFSHKGIEYLSFYDQRSETVNFYRFSTQKFVGKINLKKWFSGRSLYKTSVYVRNFDSIYINNLTALYLFNRKGNKIKSIDFLDKPEHAWAVFENTSQPAFINGQLFAAVRPYVDDASMDDLKKWKVIYGFDLLENKARLYYNLPDIYLHNLYGYHFLDYNFCISNRGNFVFSFPADTNIYETNLTNYHLAYYAKSRFQKSTIAPIAKQDLKNDADFKQYKLRDAYGPIFFDPYKKRYLRLAKQKISEASYDAKIRQRKQSVILFDENFRLISESIIPDDFSFSTLIFSVTGSMYVRVNSMDENALYFAKVVYNEVVKDSLVQLTKNENK